MPVTQVEDVTGLPEMLDERVKTLHPKIHGGLLADRGNGVAPRRSRTARHRAVRPRRLEPLSVPRTARDRDDRHRRPGDGARARRRTTRGSRSSPSPTSTTPLLEELRANDGNRRRRDAPRASRSRRSRTRPRTTPRSCSGCRASEVLPAAPDRRARAHRRGAALRREPAPAGGALPPARRRRAGGTACTSTAASRCRTSTSTTPTPRGSSCTTSVSGPACAIIKHANPCGVAVAGDARRRVPTRARVRRTFGVRWHRRAEPADRRARRSSGWSRDRRPTS